MAEVSPVRWDNPSGPGRTSRSSSPGSSAVSPPAAIPGRKARCDYSSKSPSRRLIRARHHKETRHDSNEESDDGCANSKAKELKPHNAKPCAERLSTGRRVRAMDPSRLK